MNVSITKVPEWGDSDSHTGIIQGALDVVVTRDKDGALAAWYWPLEPHRLLGPEYGEGDAWEGDMALDAEDDPDVAPIYLPGNLCPEITWDDDPVKMKIFLVSAAEGD